MWSRRHRAHQSCAGPWYGMVAAVCGRLAAGRFVVPSITSNWSRAKSNEKTDCGGALKVMQLESIRAE